MPRRCSFKLEQDYPEPLAGVDEAGCAPLAGPVVAAACILDRDRFPRGIDDLKGCRSKSARRSTPGCTRCAAWGVGIAAVEEIDQLNIYWARMLAMSRAVDALGLEPAMGAGRRQCAARAGSGRRRRSSPATPSAARSPPPRSSPRSPATGSWPTMRANIRAMAGSITGATDARTSPRARTSSGRRRCTAEASRLVRATIEAARRSRSWFSKKSRPASPLRHTHQRLSPRPVA